MKNTENKTLTPATLAAILAALSAAEKAIDLHGKLEDWKREELEIDAAAAILAARRAVESAPDAALSVPVEILDHAREWTRGDLKAAEWGGENKTEIDVDTLRARMAALDRMENAE